MKVVIFVAHPDDEVLGMGGTILKHSQKGDFVKVVYLATGITSRRSTNFQNNISYEQNENKINEIEKQIKDLRNDAKKSCNILKVKDCDLLINIGARFDDRITGKIDEFSPKSKKIHIDIDPSSINKIVKVDLAIVGDVSEVIKSTTKTLKKKNLNLEKSNKQKISKWWQQIQKWRLKQSLNFINSDKIIKPQHAVQRLYELTKNQDTYITTEVGQHQMWAAQHYKFNKPNRWMTSGGLGTMGYGLPAAIGVQVAHPKKLVVDIAGEASILMTMQEISTAVQYNLPIKIFILNNQYMGMVRQWQELLHEKNYSESYSEALPDFVKLAEAYGCVGIRAENPDELDEKIEEMINIDRPVIFDCLVDKAENCYPMIPSGKPHNQMLLGPKDQEENKITGKGKSLV